MAFLNSPPLSLFFLILSFLLIWRSLKALASAINISPPYSFFPSIPLLWEWFHHQLGTNDYWWPCIFSLFLHPQGCDFCLGIFSPVELPSVPFILGCHPTQHSALQRACGMESGRTPRLAASPRLARLPSTLSGVSALSEQHSKPYAFHVQSFAFRSTIRRMAKPSELEWPQHSRASLWKFWAAPLASSSTKLHPFLPTLPGMGSIRRGPHPPAIEMAGLCEVVTNVLACLLKCNRLPYLFLLLHESD